MRRLAGLTGRSWNVARQQQPIEGRTDWLVVNPYIDRKPGRERPLRSRSRNVDRCEGLFHVYRPDAGYLDVGLLGKDRGSTQRFTRRIM